MESTEGPWKLTLETTRHSDKGQDEEKYVISVVHMPTGRMVKRLEGSDVSTKFDDFASGYKKPELLRIKDKEGNETIKLKVLNCKTCDHETFLLKEPT